MLNDGGAWNVAIAIFKNGAVELFAGLEFIADNFAENQAVKGDVQRVDRSNRRHALSEVTNQNADSMLFKIRFGVKSEGGEGLGGGFQIFHQNHFL